MPEIVIIGAGFAGLAAAIKLKQNGLENFVVLEKAHDIGGVWRDNTYPGCAVDVEAPLYSLSSAPNPQWSQMFAGQKEIWDYQKKIVKDFDLKNKIKLNHDVTQLKWDDDKEVWNIQTSEGAYQARHVIAAFGALNVPAYPKVKGLSDFKGPQFHSARWDHSVDLKNKTVAVIGTGASAVQFVPAIQPLVKKLILFQRTPAWIVPRPDRKFSEKEKNKFSKWPWLQKLLRLRIFLFHEALVFTFLYPKLMTFARHISLRHLRRAVKNPELREKLTPRYIIGCKRILLSNDYWPSLDKPNVEVLTEALEEVREHSVVSKSGNEYTVDALIFGTGFQVTEMPFAKHVVGREEKNLADLWKGSPFSYQGTMVTGFPNFYILQGPNTGLGHSSVLYVIEQQIDFILSVLKLMKSKKLSSMEPTQKAMSLFNEKIDKKMAKTVWKAGGCVSWYLDKTGRNSTLWPGTLPGFAWQMRHLDLKDYQSSPQKTGGLQ